MDDEANRQWYFVGHPDAIGTQTKTAVWSIFDTLENVALMIEDVNHSRKERNWPLIRGRPCTIDEMVRSGRDWVLNPTKSRNNAIDRPASAIAQRFRSMK